MCQPGWWRPEAKEGVALNRGTQWEWGLSRDPWVRSGSQTSPQGRQILLVSLILGSPGSSWELLIGQEGTEAGGHTNINSVWDWLYSWLKHQSLLDQKYRRCWSPADNSSLVLCWGPGRPHGGIFTCWDLPQKCVLTILWTINKNSHGKQLSKTVTPKGNWDFIFLIRSSRNCDYSELPLNILVNIWEIPSASCCPKSGKPGMHQLTHSYASAFGLIAPDKSLHNCNCVCVYFTNERKCK